jgi:hypothetical protein
MQDQWVGDDGDILKYGLLRHLIRCGGAAINPLGVCWYRRESQQAFHGVPDESLLETVRPLRSIEQVEEADLLQGAVFFRDLLGYVGGAREAQRREAREEWHANARRALEDCPTVFLDPDNGMDPDDSEAKEFDRSRLAHVRWSELKDWWERGHRTVLLFQHARRDSNADERIAEQIGQELELSTPPVWVRHRARWLYIVPATRHRATIERLLGSFCQDWAEWLG